MRLGAALMPTAQHPVVERGKGLLVLDAVTNDAASRLYE